MRRIAIGVATVTALWGTGASAEPLPACPGGQAHVALAVTIDGPVELTRAATAGPLALGAGLCPGDLVSTGEGGRAEIRMIGRDTTIGITENTSLGMGAPPEARAEGAADVTLTGGLLRFVSSVRGLFDVGTRYGNAGIDGTEAVVAVAEGGTLVLVREGVVALSGAAGGPLALAAGQAGFAAEGDRAALAAADRLPPALRPLLVDQAGVSDWAIHYPPILLGAELRAPTLDAAREALAADDPDRAEALLGQVPEAGRAGAAALALRAVVATRRGRIGEALDLADRAVALDPGFGAAAIARSYALQGAGQLDAALAAARRGAALAPDDAYAQARRAELELALGRRAEARDSAERSLALAETALGHAILGLAALALYDDAAAEAAFDRAVTLASDAPLPRLGLGLFRIRQGDLVAGREELELAVSLDPKRGDLRSWLGRAYAEEGLSDKALAQFDLAKELDPDNPNAWLFSAAELFEANRPLEAVEEIETAARKAPDRAVLRGPRGLGEDRAVTSASLGRALDAVGFAESALQAGARAVEQDPTNGAAHRVLADLAAGDSGLSFAASSSALKARLLSPPNLAPVDAAIGEPDLALLDQSGPARASFGEYSPFFDRYGIAGRASVFGGTQGTGGEAVSLTASDGGWSLGLGQTVYRTSGYRFNNELRHTLFTLETKAEVAPGLSLFAEAGLRDTRSGDRSLSFDFAADSPFLTVEDRRTRGRVGLHARLGADQDILAVATARTQDLSEDTVNTSLFNPIPEVTDTDAYGVDLQGQHIGRFGPVTTVVGGAFTREVRDSVLTLEFPASPFVAETSDDVRVLTGYGYATYGVDLARLTRLEVTAGFGVDRLNAPDRAIAGAELDITKTVLGPKGGIRVEIADRLNLRAAYTETLTPALLFDQRIEPVTVAGFAQYRPEALASEVRQAQAGAEIRPLPWLTLGGTGAWRRVEPQLDFSRVAAEEVEGEIYATARLGRRFAARIGASRLDINSALDGDFDDYEVTEVGAELRYFDRSGFFARIGLDYVDFESIDNDGLGREADDFVLGAIGLGYRLPDKRGVVSLELTNAFDEEFGFRERPARAFGADVLDPVYPRDFTAFARVSLSF